MLHASSAERASFVSYGPTIEVAEYPVSIAGGEEGEEEGWGGRWKCQRGGGGCVFGECGGAKRWGERPSPEEPGLCS
mgnify:CR=1 FL=1